VIYQEQPRWHHDIAITKKNSRLLREPHDDITAPAQILKSICVLTSVLQYQHGQSTNRGTNSTVQRSQNYKWTERSNCKASQLNKQYLKSYVEVKSIVTMLAESVNDYLSTFWILVDAIGNYVTISSHQCRIICNSAQSTILACSCNSSSDSSVHLHTEIIRTMYSPYTRNVHGWFLKLKLA